MSHHGICLPSRTFSDREQLKAWLELEVAKYCTRFHYSKSEATRVSIGCGPYQSSCPFCINFNKLASGKFSLSKKSCFLHAHRCKYAKYPASDYLEDGSMASSGTVIERNEITLDVALGVIRANWEADAVLRKGVQRLIQELDMRKAKQQTEDHDREPLVSDEYHGGAITFG